MNPLSSSTPPDNSDNHRLNSYLDLNCFQQSPDSFNFQKWVFVLICFLNFIAIYRLHKDSQIRVKQITWYNAEMRADQVQTYCIFSLLVVRTAQLMLIFLFLHQISYITLLLIDDHFIRVAYEKKTDSTAIIKPFAFYCLLFVRFVEMGINTCVTYILALQFFEMLSMRYVIKTQDKRQPEQIMFDHQFENVLETRRLS